MSEQLQLQISLSIGRQRYEIKVPKQAELPSLVRAFLAHNHLNPKYEASIVRMVLQKLEEHSASTQRNSSNKHTNKPQSRKVTVPEQLPKSGQQQRIKPIAKIEQFEERKESFEDSRKIFQGWKLREKEKEKMARQARSRQQFQTTRSPLKPQRHQSDYFYKKGVQFKKNRELSCEKLFKQHYPFQTRERVLTQADQTKLFDKLHYQRKGNPHCNHFTPDDHSLQREHKLPDPVKAFLRAQDEKVDRQIHKMLQSGQLSQIQRSEFKGGSAFRKTILN